MRSERSIAEEGYTVSEMVIVTGITVFLALIVAGVVVMVHFITKHW